MDEENMGIGKIVFIGFFAMILIAAAAIGGGYMFYNSQVNKKISVNSEEPIKISIKRGMSVDQIGAYLKEQKLIDYPIVLKAYLYLNPDKTIQAGYYETTEKDLNLPKLIDVMQNGSFEKKLTFIEGWRVEEYTDYLRKEMSPEFAEEFAQASVIKQGHMFPDTYLIEADYEAEKLAVWMNDTFNKKAKAGEWEEKAALRGMTLEDVVTMASIVEREMHIKNERRIVAGILIKRLEQGWPLQADATIQFAKGTSSDWWPKATSEDLKTMNTPYNTYLNKGLPPGPICNPSADSIEAVLEYEKTPYWYYATGKDGVTHYAETLEKHNYNIANYL